MYQIPYAAVKDVSYAFSSEPETFLEQQNRHPQVYITLLVNFTIKALIWTCNDYSLYDIEIENYTSPVTDESAVYKTLIKV